MNVVGHPHEFLGIQFDLATELRRPKPLLPYNFTQPVPAHFSLQNFAKQPLVVVRANGDEVSACLGVIVVSQPYAAMPSGR